MERGIIIIAYGLVCYSIGLFIGKSFKLNTRKSTLQEMHDLLSEMHTITQPEKDAIVNSFYQYLKNK